jgi:NAD(P)-dependent dehydrogenase (short-subunit alcohol dehydrogenase family)/acyl carrier protein/SAM-dependent methyltransferase
LHPGLVDAALQTMSGIFSDPGSTNQLFMLPFSLERVEILQALPARGYAYVKSTNREPYPCFNVAIVDDTGGVCLKLYEVALRKLADPLEHFFYMPGWQSLGLPAAPGKTVPTGIQRVLIIYPQALGDSGVVPALAAYHARAKHEVFHMRLGAKGRKPGRNSRGQWEIDANEPGAIDRCLKQLKGKSLDVIYFLGGIQVQPVKADDPEALTRSQEYGVLSLFRLVQSVCTRGLVREGHTLQLKVITNDIYQVLPGDDVKPFSAGLPGLSKAMSKENRQLAVRCIDLRSEDITGTPGEETIELLVSPVGAGEAEEIALRNGRCYRRILEPVQLPAVSDRGLPFKHRGVYLIVGGAGGIGLELSLHLAKTVAARLVLMGRSQLDTRQQEKIARIEAEGGQVLYLQADVSDLKAMEMVVKQAKEHFGTINGAIHSAVVLQDKTLENMDESTFRAVLTPKVTGSVVLYKVLKDEPLDFLLFFSSAQSFVCNAGQGNYAAACSFKDAFALHISQCESYPVRVINWGYWGSVGIVATEAYNTRMSVLGARSIEPGEGMEAVNRALAHRVIQVAAMKAEEQALKKLGIDPENYLELYPEKIPAVFNRVLSRLQPRPPEPGTLQQFDRAMEELTKLGQRLLLHAFQEMGVFLRQGEHYNKADLQKNLGIDSGYTPLYHVLLEILANIGWIRLSNRGQEIETLSILENTDSGCDARELARQKDRLLTKYPEITPHIRMLWTCLKAYPDILKGNIPATDVMFPSSSMGLVEGIYKGNVNADYFNGLVVQCVQSYIRARLPLPDPGDKINILEIGAGTGGTSALVLEAIRDYREHLKYFYTDISMSFIQYGKKHYHDRCGFVCFDRLDIESDPVEQGFKPGSFDMVIAANVLHATRDLRETLNNIKALLKTNGWLILNEATGIHLFTTLTFGLLAGWWRFRDEENRLHGGPLLSSHMWERLLKEEGFALVRSFGQPGGNKKVTPVSYQHIVVAQGNGVVRKKRTVQAVRPEQIKTASPIEEPQKQVPQQQVPLKRGLPQTREKDVRVTVKNAIVENLAQVLEIDAGEFDADASYTDFGVDSILAVEIITRLNEQLSIQLRTTDLFNYPTIGQLTDHIVDESGFTLPDQDNGRVNAPGLFSGCPDTREEPEDQVDPEAIVLESPGDEETLKLLERVERGELDIYEAYELLGEAQ